MTIDDIELKFVKPIPYKELEAKFTSKSKKSKKAKKSEDPFDWSDYNVSEGESDVNGPNGSILVFEDEVSREGIVTGFMFSFGGNYYSSSEIRAMNQDACDLADMCEKRGIEIQDES